MSKQSENIKASGGSAFETQKSIPDIHTAFNTWMENHAEYVNLRFQYGSKLFMRENGVYIIQAVRIAFEAFKYEFPK